ncbi:MAG: hypothetical protein NC918_07150 [Candidatus Omnitrophica bacterium]|nr:hypothetical protein [Candidatus Omnitrophota bacterium]
MQNYTRKIQIVGKRSYSITLPKKWVLKNKLEKKEININEEGSNLIISLKKDKNYLDEKEIFVDNLDLIPSILLLCYTRAVSKLKLVFKTKEDYLLAKPLVLEMLSHLEGFKIVDEKENSIEIKDFYEGLNLNIRDLAKKMMIIMNNILDCILNDNNKTKEILEQESDSIYHLSKRVLYAYTKGLVNSSEDFLDIEEIFLWRLIFKKLENINDILEKIKKESFKKENIQDVLNNLNSVIIFNKKIKIEDIKKIKEKNFKDSENNKLKELVIDVLNNLLLIELNKKFF